MCHRPRFDQRLRCGVQNDRRGRGKSWARRERAVDALTMAAGMVLARLVAPPEQSHGTHNETVELFFAETFISSGLVRLIREIRTARGCGRLPPPWARRALFLFPEWVQEGNRDDVRGGAGPHVPIAV